MKMTMNKTAKREQYQEAEQELVKLIEEVEGIEEGDLKTAPNYHKSTT